MNNILTTKTIAREALPILESNLIFPSLIYNDYSEEIAKKGDTVQVRKPPVYNATEFDGEIEIQDVNEEEVLVKLDKIADVSVELTAKEMALSAEDFSKQVLEPAMVAIAEKINADGLALYKDIFNVYGSAGETPDNLSDIAGSAKALNNNKAPLVGRSGVWNTDALANFQQIPTILSAEKTGENSALREGSIGRIFGVDHYFCQQIPQHEKGTLAGDITVSQVKEDGNVVLANSGNGTLKAGDILTVDGATYVVKENAQTESGSITVKTSPAMPSETVGKAVAVTANHVANLVFQKNAFGFVTRPLEVARGADSYVTNYKGLSVRVTMDYNIATKKQTMSIDTLYGFKTLYPELAVRVLG